MKVMREIRLWHKNMDRRNWRERLWRKAVRRYWPHTTSHTYDGIIYKTYASANGEMWWEE